MTFLEKPDFTDVKSQPRRGEWIDFKSFFTMYYKSANQRTKPDRQHQHSYSFCLLPLYFSSYRLQFKCPLRIRGISTLLTTCNNKVLLTAVCSRSKKKSTTAAAALRKKHLKDIRRFGSEFKWKLNQGVKSL